ncbi:MAG: preprotein translocase subunit SecG [Clostridiaceae bacterium]|nr:preprotein translocase subunit SecG [Clostridiaceae bacterium]
MTTIQTVLAVVMILASIFLTFTILMQSGSRQGMSGTISGGAETFFGSGKAKGMDAMLNKLTIVVAAVFIALAIVLNILQ